MTDKVEDKHATGWPTVRRLFDIEQAADVAEEPVEQIFRWVTTGQLRAYHLGGRVRIDEVELADFLTSPRSNQP